ncbi:hypothetical protein [Sorangium sp. So ce362]|uniref:hypothetical protein n=1 Tax=Sorangium sp. So ce362 TaxID=3133303 RepID=UPI003F6212B7
MAFESPTSSSDAVVGVLGAHVRDVGPSADIDGVGIEDFATIGAAIAEGDHPLEDVLRAFGLTTAQWDAISAQHTRRIAADAFENDPSTLADAYAAAFARAQDALRPVPAMTPENWAAVATEVAARGDEALVTRGLRRPDFLRLSRHWARELSRSPAVAKRYFAAVYAEEQRRKG